jgi:hypothetical protein
MIAGAMASIGALVVGPLVYPPLKRWGAARSVERFLSHGYRRRHALPISTIAIPAGGQFRCSDAFDGRLASDLRVTVVFGHWARGTVFVRGVEKVVSPRVAGFIVRAPALPDLRAPDLLLVAPIVDGTLVLWSDLPTAESMTRHGRELSHAMETA